MTANPVTVTELRSARRATVAAPSSAKPARKTLAATARRAASASPAARRQLWSGVSALAVGAVLTGASLSHLAHGIEATAHNGQLDAWIMAVGIDLGFLTAEGACLCAAGPSAATVLRWGKPMVAALLALSTGMNAMAAASGAVGLLATAGSALIGMALPLIVYGCTRIAFAQLTGKGA